MDLKLEKLFERMRPAAQSLDRLANAFMNDLVAGILRRESLLLTDLTPRERRAVSFGLLSSDALRRQGGWYVTASALLTPYRIGLMESALGEGNASVMVKGRMEGMMKGVEDARRRVVIWASDVLRDHLADMDAAALPGFLVLDDAEYLGHPDAGATLEEIVLCLPPSLPVVLLVSAISNGPELARWLEESRRTPCRTIGPGREPGPGAAPAPVVPAFISSGWEMVPLLDNKSLTGKVKRFLKEASPFPGVRSGGFVRRLATVLREEGLVPALVLTPSESDCDAAAAACEPVFKEIGDALTEPRVAAGLDRHPSLKEHPLLTRSLMRRSAPLHAGHHPLWCEWVERFIELGYLDLVFSVPGAVESMTAAVRCAVLCTSSIQIDGPGGREFRPLSQWEMHHVLELLGRAEGPEAPCIAIAHAPHTDAVHLKDMLPVPVRRVSGVFRCSFPVALGLFARTDAPESLLERSLSVLQTPDEGEAARLEALTEELRTLLPEPRCIHNIETIRSLITLRYRLVLRRDDPAGRRGKGLRGWEKARAEEERDYIGQVLGRFPCEDCGHLPFCHKRGYKKLRVLIDEYCKIRGRALRGSAGMKLNFERYAQCLESFGMIGPDRRLTPMGILALRTGLRFPQPLVEVLKNGLLLSSDLDRSLAIIGGFVESPEVDHLLRTGPLEEEIEELGPDFAAMEPVLLATAGRMLRFGMLASRPSIWKSAVLSALGRGMRAQTLAEKCGVTVGALMELAGNAQYLVERVRGREWRKNRCGDGTDAGCIEQVN